MLHTRQANNICNNFRALDIWTQTYPKGLLVNLYNDGNSHHTFGQRIWICNTSNTSPLDNIKLISLTPVLSYIASHWMCTLVLYVCTCVCDCSDSSIMALQGPKHERFNNIRLLGTFCKHSVFTREKKNICNCGTLYVVHYWVPYS
jgi:hypothetical protein